MYILSMQKTTKYDMVFKKTNTKNKNRKTILLLYLPKRLYVLCFHMDSKISSIYFCLCLFLFKSFSLIAPFLEQINPI